MKPRAYIDQIDSEQDDVTPRTVHLVLQYEDKEARLEIPVTKPQYEHEPGSDVYRRELKTILMALQEVVASPEGIYWPSHRGT